MNATGETDGAGNSTWAYVYDSANPYSLLSETNGNSNTWTYTYDNTHGDYGNIATIVSPRGVTSTWTWSYTNFGLGELMSKQDSYVSNGTTVKKSPTTFTWDESHGGLVASITKPAPGTIGGTQTVTTKYFYNQYGDMTQIVSPGNATVSSNTITLSYGSTPAVKQPLTITDNIGHAITCTYDAQGNYTSMTYLAQTGTTGNEVDFGTAMQPGYNLANQRLLVLYPATGESGSGRASMTMGYQYPAGRRPMCATTTRATPAAPCARSTTPTAKTTYGGTTLAFDPENRLTKYGASTMSATYDATSLRASKTNSGETTYYLYDGRLPVCELSSTGAVTATNTFGGSGLLSRHAGTTSTFYTLSTFYVFDTQGNVSERLSSTGAVQTASTFDAFGLSTTTGTVSDPFSYCAKYGYYTDTETGLQLATYRYYDPSAGRFLTRDPINYAGGINLYNYTHNNAVNLQDPNGESPSSSVSPAVVACEANCWTNFEYAAAGYAILGALLTAICLASGLGPLCWGIALIFAALIYVAYEHYLACCNCCTGKGPCPPP